MNKKWFSFSLVMVGLFFIFICNRFFFTHSTLEEEVPVSNFQTFFTQNMDLFSFFFERDYDFSKVEDRILFVHHYEKVTNGVLSTSFTKDFWKEAYQNLFLEELKDEDLKYFTVSNDVYYNAGSFPDGGYPSFYPVLNRFEMDNDILSVTLVDYQSIDPSLTGYDEIEEITDDYLNLHGLKPNKLTLSFFISSDEIYLLSSLFSYQSEVTIETETFESPKSISLSSFKSKESLQEFLKSDHHLLAILFETYYKSDHELHFDDSSERIRFLRDYLRYLEDEEHIKYVETLGPTSEVYIEKDYLSFMNDLFFLDTLEIDQDTIYDISSSSFDSCYPIFENLSYHKETNQYELSIIDYRSLDPFLEDYFTKTRVLESDLKGKQVKRVILNYKKVGDKYVLLSSSLK